MFYNGMTIYKKITAITIYIARVKTAMKRNKKGANGQTSVTAEHSAPS